MVSDWQSSVEKQNENIFHTVSTAVQKIEAFLEVDSQAVIGRGADKLDWSWEAARKKMGLDTTDHSLKGGQHPKQARCPTANEPAWPELGDPGPILRFVLN